MKEGRNILFYITVLGFFGVLMYYIIQQGTILESQKDIQEVAARGDSVWNQFLESNHHNMVGPLAILLLQIITIIIIARIVGVMFRLIGQPMVIGEIAAGVILGPSLFGAYFPEMSGFLFPVASLGNLQFLSQIGLILFMFIIGMELDLKILKNRASDAVIISHASIVIPFSLGVGLAYFLYTDLSPDHINFLSFSLFMGISMSITAFPVLARIVQERGMTKTHIGALVITCAAADDITAWSILAAVVAIVKAGSFVNSLYTIALALVYIVIMLKVIKPFLQKLGDIHSSKENLGKSIVAIFFVVLFLSAYTTELIGIHALFGAFMAGVIMPGNPRFRNIFVEKLEDVAVVLFLPLFFVFTGLRTEIGLLNDVELWKDFALIIAVAVVGKFVGSALAAKFVGQRWKDSLMIGALMNTRGLMELVVLNIAYDLGVLSPEIFTMLVLMALVTTFMTGPALAFINFVFPKDLSESIPVKDEGGPGYNILLSFGNPSRGRTMLRLAYGLVRKSKGKNSITSLHLTPIDNLIRDKHEESEYESFQPINEESQILKYKIDTIFKMSKNINRDIIETANNGNYQLLIVGMGQSVLQGTLLGQLLGFTTQLINPSKLMDLLSGKEKLFKDALFDDHTSQIIKKSKVPVGIFIDKDLTKVEKVMLVIFSASDLFLINYANMFYQHNDAKALIYDFSKNSATMTELMEKVKNLGHSFEENISIFYNANTGSNNIEPCDLVIVSLNGWKELIETKHELITGTSSVLILNA